jgi:branched-chain amino acid transport system substrate-binding protein
VTALPLRRPQRAARAAATIGVATLALAACGGGGEPGGEAPASESSTSSSSSAPAAEGDGTLTIGSLLPQTGSLAFLGPPEFAGVKVALEEINAAGGYNGKDVTYIESDSGDDKTDIANQSVDRMLGEDVDVIVGAASSSVTKLVIDKITGAGVLQISPANTSPDFTDYPDDGLYFRTAPSDVLQGRVLGDTVIADGHLDVAILALDDDYGTGLLANAKQSIEAGGGTVVFEKVYDPAAASFSSEVSAVAASGAEALILISFDEIKKILPELIGQKIGPADLPLYLVDGNIADYSKDFPPGSLTGAKGTLPGAETTGDFKTRLTEVDPSLTAFPYSPESYDATIISALAATVAGDDSGKAIAGALQDVTGGGEKCTTYADCLALAEAGTDLDYDGVSGPIEFDENGDPTEATIGIYQYGEDNTYTNLEYRPGKL